MSAQASSLSILVDEKRVNDLLKQKTGAKAFLRSALNLLAFIFFISLFTGLAMQEPLAKHRSFQAYLKHRFDLGAAVRLSEVNDIAGFYTYWNQSFIPALYSNNTRQYTFAGVQLPEMLKIDGTKANNWLFGLVRVRMVKVKPDLSCGVQQAYQGDFPTCYGPFSAEAEDRENFGPEDVISGPMFVYSDAGELPWPGWLAEYPGSGYMQGMDGNYTDALALIQKLKDHDWVSPATRAIWFEWTTYNLNLGLYAVCRISFEASPVGGWIKTFDVDILEERHLKPLGDGKGRAWLLLILEALLVCFVFRYLFEEASEFIGCDNSKGRNPFKRMRIKWGYFTDGWNIIDWTNLILMITCLILRVMNWGNSYEELMVGVDLHPEVYLNLHDTVLNVRLIRSLTAFNATLTWFKAVKYINILPYILTFMETMACSWKYLLSWAAIFATSLMGFCLSYCTAFGESISDFRTVPRSFVFLMRAFIGNADMRLVYDANPVIGSMLILMFVVSMVFINMNLFYAILISYMSDARMSMEMEQAKRTAKFMDKVYGAGNMVARALQLEARFRSCVPGLWSRMKTWEKNRLALEKKRDERMAMRAKMQMPHEDIEERLGSSSPTYGRREKREFKQEVEDDFDIQSTKSDPESEPDLGPLRFKEQLEKRVDHHDDHHHHHHDHHDHLALEDEHHDKENGFGMPGGFGIPQQEEEVEDRDEDAKELVLKATEHVVQTIKDRCRGARILVTGEMNEARQVLNGIGNVLEVLGRRARSLEAQQEQVLPPEVIARVRAEQAAAEEAEDF